MSETTSATRGLIPSWLADPLADRVPRTRSTRRLRDWVVDLAVAAIAVAVGVSPIEGVDADRLPHWIDVLDLPLLIVAVLALFWRRRFPFTVMAIALVASTAGPGALPALAVAVFACGRYAAPATAIAGIALVLAISPIGAVLQDDMTATPLLGDLIATIGFLLAFALAGLWFGAREQLVRSLRREVEQSAEQERLRVEQARLDERGRIARETHDVLAHRLSQLSIQAGALEYRTDADPRQVAAAAGAIRMTAHQALEELRDVVGVLRGDELGAAAGTPDRPQRSLADVDELVEEWRSTGADVRLERHEAGAPPAGSGRTAFRIVQEALTNAAKHANGTRVEVTIDGGPGRGLTVSVANRLPVGSAIGPGAAIPGAGMGMVGLQERVRLVGGTLEAGADDGVFRLTALLPWEHAA